MAHEIFVGYRRADQTDVASLVSAIESRGYTVFWDPLIVAGDDWHESLDAEIKAAKTVIIVWSQNVRMDSPLTKEAEQGFEQKKLIIVSIDSEVDVLHKFKHRQVANLSPRRLNEPGYWRRNAGNPNWDEHPQFENLIEAILKKVGNPAKKRAAERARVMRSVVVLCALAAAVAVLGWVFLGLTDDEHLPSPLFASGEVFSDCQGCPEMSVLPGGDYSMGATERRQPNEQQRNVSIEPFAIARFEVSLEEYVRFLNASSHQASDSCFVDLDGNGGLEKIAGANLFQNLGFSQANVNEPVVCVSWDDAHAFAQWLSQETGREYRLVREAEWEYAARANSEQPDYASSELCEGINGGDQSLVDSLRGRRVFPPRFALECTDGVANTASRESGAPNAFGLVHMIGNVDEWVADCYAANRLSSQGEGCADRVIRGGSWRAGLVDLRFASRTFGRDLRENARAPSGAPVLRSDVGFRVATSDLRRELPREE